MKKLKGDKDNMKKNTMATVYYIIVIWTVMFILCQVTNLKDILCGKGMHLLAGEYYRVITGAFLHLNLIHLLANILALYFVTIYLNGKINGWMVMIIGIIGSTIAEGVFLTIFPDTHSSVGGSGIIFSIIGFILVCQIIWKNCAPFQLGTWYGNWTLGYAILSNLISPKLGGPDISTILFHVLALIGGFIVGTVLLPRSCVLWHGGRRS